MELLAESEVLLLGSKSWEKLQLVVVREFFVEPRMLESLSGRDSLLRFRDKHRQQEISELFSNLGLDLVLDC